MLLSYLHREMDDDETYTVSIYWAHSHWLTASWFQAQIGGCLPLLV